MSETVVNLVDIRETSVPKDDAGISQDQSTCRVCNKGIDHLYSGRGRRPVVCEEHKSNGASKIGTKGTARGNASAALAADALDDAYAMVSFALMFVTPNASSLLAQSREAQREKNIAHLSKDPELCKMINKVGKSGGRMAFFLSQAMLIGPVAILAVGELRERSAVEDAPSDAEPFAEFQTASDGD